MYYFSNKINNNLHYNNNISPIILREIHKQNEKNISKFIIFCLKKELLWILKMMYSMNMLNIPNNFFDVACKYTTNTTILEWIRDKLKYNASPYVWIYVLQNKKITADFLRYIDSFIINYGEKPINIKFLILYGDVDILKNYHYYSGLYDFNGYNQSVYNYLDILKYALISYNTEMIIYVLNVIFSYGNQINYLCGGTTSDINLNEINNLLKTYTGNSIYNYIKSKIIKDI